MVKAVPAGLRIAAIIFVVLTAILLLAPLVVVIGVSLSESQFIAFPPNGVSLVWYKAALTSDAYLSAFWLSLKLALAVTASATIIGGAVAIALSRRSLPFSIQMETVFLAPLILPSIIYAIGMLMLWSTLFGAISFAALWVSHTVICLPYVVRTTLAVLAESDPFLEQAARTMGANRLQRLIYVVLPQCRPGLIAGAFFAFNISFDEAVLSLFLRNPQTTTLPVQIYGQLEFSPDPTVAAVSTIMIAITVILIVVIDRILGLQRFASS
ncbi:ABC transporter permease [Rhizobium sp. SSA_523]|uniref:ABC transporter permease n=1 Tax=Rhizobium sp. SSA_523 TaxID=2952477 RepID=UPI0020900A85|nr:ABC transporter permease [Rhizobium sp. SSA_523]MCO5733453.1 ABC transporter permease [Rhizobium sp. SSA_523]WKC21578.1 ABC transporter permease [Rhizobium sp. SSA_523]